MTLCCKDKGIRTSEFVSNRNGKNPTFIIINTFFLLALKTNLNKIWFNFSKIELKVFVHGNPIKKIFQWCCC